jgi:hypothetical protein
MPDELTDAEVAARCLEDPAFAQAVYEGSEHLEVRRAIHGDLATAAGADDADVEGFLNPQPLPPYLIVSRDIYFAPVTWSSLPRLNLTRLSTGG